MPTPTSAFLYILLLNCECPRSDLQCAPPRRDGSDLRIRAAILPLHIAMLPFAAWTLATLLATTLVVLFATDPREPLCRALGRCLDAKPAAVPPVTVSSEPAVTSPALPSLRELTTVESATTRSTPSSIASSTRCLESRSCALATRPPSAIASRPSAIVPPVDPIASWDVALLSVAALVFAVIFLCTSAALEPLADRQLDDLDWPSTRPTTGPRLTPPSSTASSLPRRRRPRRPARSTTSPHVRCQHLSPR